MNEPNCARDKPARAHTTHLSRFYVYSYWSEGVPVYVGKGSGRRDKAHLCDFERRHGLTVDRIHTNAQHLTEAQAYALELQLVRKFGRRDCDPSGTLRQLEIGGPKSLQCLRLYL